MNICINKSVYDKFKYLKNRPVNDIDIDQFLVNEADKTDLEPFNANMDRVLSQFTTEQIEKHVYDYLMLEIRVMGGKDFELP